MLLLLQTTFTPVGLAATADGVGTADAAMTVESPAALITLDPATIGVSARVPSFAGIRGGIPGPGNGQGGSAPPGYGGQGADLDPWTLRI
jgi:hypothetical protein